MAYKTYDDIMIATGKSYSAIKKWRLEIERLSGYEFEIVRERVSRKRVKDVYHFTQEEFDKFIALSLRIDETKNLKQSVIEIWGDLKAREERQLKQDVVKLKRNQNGMIKAFEARDFTIKALESRLKQVEERLESLEDNHNQGFFSKIRKK